MVASSGGVLPGDSFEITREIKTRSSMSSVFLNVVQ
jgi:hypothetical protein